MTRRRTTALVALLAALGAAAQEPSPSDRGGHLPGDGRERPRDEAFKMVEAYFVSNLQESLGLSDEQFVKVLPLVKRLQTERREQLQRRMRAMQELRQLLQSGKATEAQVADGLKEVKRAEGEGPGLVLKQQEAVDAQLTTVQQAKFRMLEIEVERKVRDLLFRAGRPDGRPAGRRGGRELP